MYRIVASDLDGTLLNGEHRLSAYTKKVLQALVKKNLTFIFATGRHHIDVAQMRENMEIDAYMITANGARIHDSQGNLILERNVLPEIASQVAQIAMNDPIIYTHIYRGDEWLSNREDKYSLSYFEESDFCYQIFDPTNFNTTEIAKVYFIIKDQANHEHLVMLKTKIDAQFGEYLNTAFSTPGCLEVMAKGVSKGSALEFLAKKIGYTLADCIAFGDGMNDYEMLSMVGKGCIMQNASQTLKTSLPHLEVIGSNKDEAVPHYLNDLYKTNL